MKLDSNDVRIPASSVGVCDAIYRRRSVKQFTNDPVPGETLDRLFSAAIWAPNQRLTEPMRFFAVRKGSPLRAKLQRSYGRQHTIVSPALIRTRVDFLRMLKGTASSMPLHWCTSTVLAVNTIKGRWKITPRLVALSKTWLLPQWQKTFTLTGAPGDSPKFQAWPKSLVRRRSGRWWECSS